MAENMVVLIRFRRIKSMDKALRNKNRDRYYFSGMFFCNDKISPEKLCSFTNLKQDSTH